MSDRPVGSIWAKDGRGYILRDDLRWLDYPSMELLTLEPDLSGAVRMSVTMPSQHWEHLLPDA